MCYYGVECLITLAIYRTLSRDSRMPRSSLRLYFKGRLSFTCLLRLFQRVIILWDIIEKVSQFGAYCYQNNFYWSKQALLKLRFHSGPNKSLNSCCWRQPKRGKREIQIMEINLRYLFGFRVELKQNTRQASLHTSSEKARTFGFAFYIQSCLLAETIQIYIFVLSRI